ncbi:hypothetical protein QE392_000078 [Microbacterium proteolyticum]|nr:hypothetical protein [Microbacterium proteolyticum]
MPGDQEPCHRPPDGRVVDGVDGRDPADAGVGDGLRLEVLHGAGVGDRVAVDAQEVVVAFDEGIAVVEGADLLVGVLADVMNEDLGELLAEFGVQLVRTAVVRGDPDGGVRGVVDDDVDDVGHAGLSQQRLDDTGDRLLLVVGGDDAPDRGAVDAGVLQDRREVVDEVLLVLVRMLLCVRTQLSRGSGETSHIGHGGALRSVIAVSAGPHSGSSPATRPPRRSTVSARLPQDSPRSQKEAVIS